MFKKTMLIAAAMLVVLTPVSAIKVYAATAANLINNPSVAADATGWNSTTWSTNTRNMTRVATGHTDNGALRAEVTKVVSGADGWNFTPVAVTPGQSYEFSFWYQSNVNTQIDASYMVNGVESDVNVGTATASAAWTQFKTNFTAPAGATSVTLTDYVSQVGYATTDDYSLASYAATPFNRPIVSVTFDDGWANQYLNARQVLKDNGINSTFYLISKELANGQGTAKEYMNATQAQALLADGHEIGDHTIDHCSMSGATKDAGCTDPTAVSPAAATQFITNEMKQSQADIRALVPGATANNFAYPYGEYSAESISIGKNYFTSQRTVECATNTKDSLDFSKLKGCDIGSASTVAIVEAMIDQAIAQKSYLVLFYHEIADAGQGVQGDEEYTVSKANFTAVMQYIKSRQADIDNMSVAKAITALNGTTTTPVTTPATTQNAVYRMYNTINNDRLLTADAHERDVLNGNGGWRYEGVAFNSAAQGNAVYRMYNTINNDRLLTADAHERDVLNGNGGWRYEGVAFNSAPVGNPVYRMYNTSNNDRLLTADTNERDVLNGNGGWRYEGVAFNSAQ